MIYLDNAASTKPTQKTMEIMKETMERFPANPSSTHTMGIQAKKALNQSKQAIASMLGAEWRNLIITSSATEATNQALFGMFKRYPNKTMITSTVEHAATKNTLKAIESMGGHVIWIPVDNDGLILISELKKALETYDVSLVSLIYAHNEIGTIQEVNTIIPLVHAYGAYVHLDMVQSIAHMDIDFTKLNADMASVSAHKFHGPRGIGMLYNKVDDLPPLIHGGGHENGKRAGTEDLASIKGMENALHEKRLEHEKREASIKHTARILLDTLKAKSVDFILNGPPLGTNRLNNVLNLSFKDIDSQTLAFELSSEGIMVSTGSACSSGEIKASPTLSALGVDHDYIEGSIRISHNHETTAQTMQHVGNMIASIIGEQ